MNAPQSEPADIDASDAHPTSGPWSVVNNGSPFSLDIDDEFGLNGGRDYYFASVTHGDPRELKKLAALVSAAPQLLAAAKLAARLLDSVAFVTKEGDTARPLRVLREAIAKGRGRMNAPRHVTRAQLAYRAIRHQRPCKPPAPIPVGEATEVDFAVWVAARGAAS